MVISQSIDAGDNWIRHELFSGSTYGYTKALAVDPNNPDRVFCLGYYNSNYVLFYTQNGGGSWQNRLLNGYSGIPNGLAVCPTNGNLLAAATSIGLYASDDGGANWYRVTTAFDGANDVQNSELFGGLLISTINGGVWLWEDWIGTPVEVGEDLYPAVQCVEENAECLYAGTTGTAVWYLCNAQGIEERPVPQITLSVSPNPVCGGAASITFSLPAQQTAVFSIYDISGRQVMAAVRGVMREGTNQISIDTSTLTSGLYFARLETEQIATTARMVVIR